MYGFWQYWAWRRGIGRGYGNLSHRFKCHFFSQRDVRCTVWETVWTSGYTVCDVEMTTFTTALMRVEKGNFRRSEGRATGRGITLYRTIRFKERIQCIGPSEFTGPRKSVNVITNWEECITGNYWADYTHRVALGDAADDAGTKLLPRKCRISTMPVSIGGSENPGNRIWAIFLPPQYSF